MWSLYKCDGPPHPDDRVDELGSQDSQNFLHMMQLHARLLEGTPLCKCVLLWSRRGRNGKGLCEKIFQSVWGDYYVPVRATVFSSDKRSEHEHNAADVFRRGARVAFGNEVLTTPWSNAVFKSRNSTDPITVRGCNATDTERMLPTYTFIFAANDPPAWEQTPKGSENDRLMIMYMPNKFHDASAVAQSPRSSTKDQHLEAEVGGRDFALGHLLNLLTIRSAAAASAGPSLHDLVTTGTATSQYWLNMLMRFWVEPPASTNDAPPCMKSFAQIKALHIRMRGAGKRAILQCQTEQTDNPFDLPGTRRSRWSALLELLRSCARLGMNLFFESDARSRKGFVQPGVFALEVDIQLYDVEFVDAEVFGDMGDYKYNLPADVEYPGQEPAVSNEADVDSLPTNPLDGERRVLYTSCEIANLAALEARLDAGPETTGERRQDSLAAYVAKLKTSGTPVSMQEGVFMPCGPDSDFRAYRRPYVQIDGFGRAYEVGCGPQGCTKETRACGFSGLFVAEFDMAAAFYQLFWEALSKVMSEEERQDSFDIVRKYAENPTKWRETVARYYSIEVGQAKEIFTRLPFRGNIRPNTAWAPDDAHKADFLPCLIELRAAFRRGQSILAAKSPMYQQIANLQKVRDAANPAASALAIYLQTMENEILGKTAEACAAHGASVLAYVFDGLYVAMPSQMDLQVLFEAVAPAVHHETGIRLVLKSMTGEVTAKFTPGPKRHADAEESQADRPPKRLREFSLTQELGSLIDADMQREEVPISNDGAAAPEPGRASTARDEATEGRSPGAPTSTARSSDPLPQPLAHGPLGAEAGYVGPFRVGSPGTSLHGVMIGYIVEVSEQGRRFLAIGENMQPMTLFMRPESFATWLWTTTIPRMTLAGAAALSRITPDEVRGHVFLQCASRGVYPNPLAQQCYMRGIALVLGDRDPGSEIADSGEYYNEECPFKNICVVQTLRAATGEFIRVNRNGPFSFLDAVRMLFPFGKTLVWPTGPPRAGDIFVIFYRNHCTYISISGSSFGVWYSGDRNIPITVPSSPHTPHPPRVEGGGEGRRVPV